MNAAAFAAIALLAWQAPVEPYRLPIGRPGETVVAPGSMVDMRTLRSATPADVALAAEGHTFIYLGESHTAKSHRQMMAAILEALDSRGRDVVVGLEMFTRPMQPALAPWTLGRWSEEEFVEHSQWKTQWGFDWGLYQPLFETVRRRRMPMVALNVPRDWVRAVGREGYTALTEAQRRDLPDELYLGNREHRAVFDALMGGHPPTGARGENIYAAQVLWDEGMADTALRYVAGRQSRRLAFAVVAGSGHVMYEQGINYRIRRRTGERGLTVVMVESGSPVTVSRGLADFVYVAPLAGSDPNRPK